MMSSIGLQKFAGVIFGITLKPLYIIPPNLVRYCITNKKISELVCWPEERLVTNSRPLLLTLPIKKDWVGKKKHSLL